jgi:membrane associated rhomboid family serine protease
MADPAEHQPILNLPPCVTALLSLNIAVHLGRQLIPDDWDDWLIGKFAVIPLRYSEAHWGWQTYAALIGHQFLHANLLHLGVNMLMLAAFGSGIERRLGGRRMLVLYLLSGLAGAVLQIFIDPASEEIMLGASGAISGLLGGVLWMIREAERESGRRGRLLLMAVVTIAAMVMTGRRRCRRSRLRCIE